MEIPALGTMDQDMKGRFGGWETLGDRRLAVIDYDGEVSIESGEGGGPMGMTMNMDSGELTGKMYFDPKLGLFTDMTFHQKMEMNMEVPKGPNGQPMKMTIDMDQRGTVRITDVIDKGVEPIQIPKIELLAIN